MIRARKIQCLHCGRLVLNSEVLCVGCMRELAEAGQEERKTRDHLEIMKQAERELMTKKRAELREFASRQNGLS